MGDPELEELIRRAATGDEEAAAEITRRYERVVRAIESGGPEEARRVMAASLAAALRTWERTAPDELKEPVAWIASDR